MPPSPIGPAAPLASSALPAATGLDLTRVLAWLGIAASALATVMVGLLHLIPPSRSLDPLSSTISEYTLLGNGWLFDAGVVALAAGSAAMFTAMARVGLLRWRSVGGAFAAAWCAGLVGLVVFPKHGFGPDTTVLGRIHWSWTLLAFVSMPIAAVLLCRGSSAGWARWARRLTVLAVGWFAVLALQTVLSATHTPEGSRLVGLVERCVAATEMAMVVVLSGWVLSVTRRRG